MAATLQAIRESALSSHVHFFSLSFRPDQTREETHLQGLSLPLVLGMYDHMRATALGQEYFSRTRFLLLQTPGRVGALGPE